MLANVPLTQFLSAMVASNRSGSSQSSHFEDNQHYDIPFKNENSSNKRSSSGAVYQSYGSGYKPNYNKNKVSFSIHVRYTVSLDIWQLLADSGILKIQSQKVVKFVGRGTIMLYSVTSEMQTSNLSKCKPCMLMLHCQFLVFFLSKCGLQILEQHHI